MSAPVRVQLSRAKGWRMPPNTVIVSRPSKWGNPFKVGGWARLAPGLGPALPIKVSSAGRAVTLFRMLCEDRTPDLSTLRGKNLACWCKLDAPCHADVLLELANAPSVQRSDEPADAAKPSYPVSKGGPLFPSSKVK